ncbi:hypothetical protein EVAR_94734_1 [Eumeta japonica]|uniref:Uncharacterized protein n=1 Tax=Eumeta variegata TaxID=151549 RepID=A0A4C1UXQ7_EUMVA|nr:hypothetical protein EVAR_94734_1 [Eumeta japonica]
MRAQRPRGGFYSERRERYRGNSRSRRVPTRATCAEQLLAAAGGGLCGARGDTRRPRVRTVNNRRGRRAHAATPRPCNCRR